MRIDAMGNLLLTGALCLVLMAIANASGAQNKSYSDTDWNTQFFDNCGLPSRTSIERVKMDGDRKLRFTLHPGDIGRCSTDKNARHSASYWERAELAQKERRGVGRRYKITSEVIFQSGFTGEREAFFQIHGWAEDCQHAYPPVMMKFTNGKMRVETLRGVSNTSSGRHRNALKKNIKISSLYGRPISLELDFDTTTLPGRLSVSLNGHQIVSDTSVQYASCAEPYVKFGIYRPGGKGSETSVVIFDDLRIEQLK